MKRWTWLSVVLVLAVVACRQAVPGTGGAGAPGAAATGQGTAVAGQRASAATAGDKTPGAATGGTAEPTLDPTLEAFYKSFQLPVKGDPNAPVTLYEFSDYL